MEENSILVASWEMIFSGGRVHIIEMFFIQVTALNKIMKKKKETQAATSTQCHNKAWFSTKPYTRLITTSNYSEILLLVQIFSPSKH